MVHFSGPCFLYSRIVSILALSQMSEKRTIWSQLIKRTSNKYIPPHCYQYESYLVFEKKVCKWQKIRYQSLRKYFLYLELFWSVFSRIPTEYWQIRSISPYSVWMRANMDQNNSEYGHFSRSEWFLHKSAYFNNAQCS